MMDPGTADQSTRLEDSWSLRTSRRMGLDGLPDEVLERIVAYLDPESLIAFGSTNRRSQRISRSSLKYARVRKIPAYVVEYLDVNGSLVQYLDLSSCKASSAAIHSVIEQCVHVTELNVINSSFRSLDTLCALKKLESLSMSALLTEKRPLARSREPLGFIKELRLDVGPNEEALRFALDLMNVCKLVEFVHANLYGSQPSLSREPLPLLASGRWKSLQTFVCTRHLSHGPFTKKFLESVFAFNPAPGIPQWIGGYKDCYIYEKGHFNGGHSGNVLDESLKLLRDVHEVEMSSATSELDAAKIFQSPWGFPRSIRVRGHAGWASELNGFSSSTLTELDLSRCHINFKENFRLSLLEASPLLESIACSLCFFLPSTEIGSTAADQSFRQGAFKEALEKLKLKKLSVSGISHLGNCCSACQCGDEGGRTCRKCQLAMPLSSSNVVDMNDLKHLEQLMLSGVSLEDSAYKKLANSGVRVVKLRLNAHNEYDGLRNFIQRCRNLNYLKLEGYDLPFRWYGFWMALDEGKSLMQLCLRTGEFRPIYPELNSKLLDCFLRIVQRVEVMHLHCADPDFTEALRDSREEAFRCLETTKHYDYDVFCSRDVRNSTVASSFSGRALCYSELSAGLVPPRGWDIALK